MSWDEIVAQNRQGCQKSMATIYYLLLIRLSVKVNWDTELNQGLRHRCYFYQKIYYRSDLIALIFYFAIKTHTKRLTIENDRKIT